MKPFMLLLVVLLVILQYEFWFAPGGMKDIVHLKHKITISTNKNNEINERNAILSADVKDLREGKEAVEERARNDLGMIKNGETYYQVTK